MNPESIIVNGGYLVRSASIHGNMVLVNADFNQTTPMEIIAMPECASNLYINGQQVAFQRTEDGTWLSTPELSFPIISLPDLKSLDWHGIDSLPEIKSNYNDSRWTKANYNYTTNPKGTPLLTPTSLYGSNYGFNTGSLVYRGYFCATGDEDRLNLTISGGNAYAASAWINQTFIGSFVGDPDRESMTFEHTIPKLQSGKSYILTVVVDSNGLNENLFPGSDSMKTPRGIIHYKLHSTSNKRPTDITNCKIAGNLGGEDYMDKFRGPLNEGGLFFERSGYHQPSPPMDCFTSASPFSGTKRAGITYYTAKFDLDLPADQYDIPISFSFGGNTKAARYRAPLYVNGFQYGKYISNIGPQTEFPVPEGILNYNGENWLGLSIWALDASGAKVPELSLKNRAPVLTSRERVQFVNSPAYRRRDGAF